MPGIFKDTLFGAYLICPKSSISASTPSIGSAKNLINGVQFFIALVAVKK
jgi:hypothetical protein